LPLLPSQREFFWEQAIEYVGTTKFFPPTRLGGSGKSMNSVDSDLGSQRRLLSFGFSTNLLSSFGQTFFISMFLLSLVQATGIAEGTFGLLYAGATLTSACILPTFGRWLDSKGERTGFLLAGIGLTLSLLLLASSSLWWGLFIAIAGLRAFGQGAMTLLSATAVARSFDRKRGLALGVSNLGFPVGEMLLPMLSIALIAQIGWRGSLLCYGIFLAITVLLIPRWILPARPCKNDATKKVAPKKPFCPKTRFQWWRDPFFLLVTTCSVTLPFASTIIILYLSSISLARDWSLSWLGIGFAGFAVIRALTSLLIGPVIDRFSGMRVFPWTLLPFSLAIGILMFAPTQWFGLGFFFFLGLGFGAGTALTALLAEVYGGERIGEVRGLATSAAVFGTAVGPFAAGMAINQNWTFDAILGSLLLLSLASLVGAFTIRFLKKAKQIS